MRRLRFHLRFVMCAIMVLVACRAFAKNVPRPDGTPPVAYVLALDTANHFLVAWANRDGDAGLKLISQGLRKRFGDSKIRDYVVGVSTPAHAAFEIGAGQPQKDDRYEFPVVLYETVGGGPDEAEGTPSTLEVVREHGKWRVERLPDSYGTP